MGETSTYQTERQLAPLAGHGSPRTISVQSGPPITEHPNRKKAEPMDEDEVAASLAAQIQDAATWIDSEIGSLRAKATQFYNGEPFGNEEDGRSQVVSMDVRDTVQSIMPSLLRIFFGPENVAEFMPRSSEDTDLAEQATDYIDFILKVDNPGFLILHSLFKDALVRKTGIVKWWWDESTQVKQDKFSGLDHESLGMMMQELEGIDHDLEIDGVDHASQTVSVTVTRRKTSGRARIEAVPPEEFLIDRKAKSIAKASITCHRAIKTVSDLVAMGYDFDEVLEYAGSGGDTLDSNQEVMARNPQALYVGQSDNDDPSMRPVEYFESQVLIDQDGDGIAELREICTIGAKHHILHNEIISERTFADFCPDPEPHTFFGLSITDVVADIQKIKSSVLRSTLDSLALSIFPRTAVVEGKVNMQDALNNEIGALLRVTEAGAAQPFVLPFVGKEAFPMMDYLDSVKEQRTGMSKAAVGLDADALQSTTKAAVSATVNAAHQHIELIARIFAETGLKSMFRGLLRLVVAHQDKERVIRLRNKWVPMNPASWDADMDVAVNLAVGAGTQEDRTAMLLRVADVQSQIIQQFGPTNPLVHVSNFRATWAKILESAGFKDASQFFLEVDPNAQIPNPPSATSGSDQAAQLLAQAQANQTNADIAIKKAELDLKRQTMLLQDAREREKMQADTLIRSRELELKYNGQVNIAQIEAAIQHEKTSADTALEVHNTNTQAATDTHAAHVQAISAQQIAQAKAQADAHKTNMQAVMQRGQHQHELALQQQAQAAAAAQAAAQPTQGSE